MNTQTLTFQNPIIRGETKITEITLNKPNVSAMRGLSLNALLNMDVGTIADILPRISEPVLAPSEINKMGCADILQAGIMVAGFFLPTSEPDEMA